MNIFKKKSALNYGEYYDFGTGYIIARAQNSKEWEIVKKGDGM